jgi:hypothetical protein
MEKLVTRIPNVRINLNSARELRSISFAEVRFNNCKKYF